MNTFRLTIMAPDRRILDDDVQYCAVRSVSGGLGLEARHAPLAVILAPQSTVRWKDTNGKEQSCRVTEGMLVFADKRCTILIPAIVKNSQE